MLTINTTATAVTGPVIIGRVTTTAGAPISGATVNAGGGITGTTDAAGYYRIRHPPAPTR